MSKIVVVGAGLAGLTAAYRLKKQGFEVHVYEARSRPGGRVLTTYFGDCYEELGGKNIGDGGKAPCMRTLISELGMSIQSQEVKNSRLVYMDGSIFPFSDLFKNAPCPDVKALEYYRTQKATTLGELLDLFLGKDTLLRRQMERFVCGWEGTCSNKLCSSYFESSFWPFYVTQYSMAHGDVFPWFFDTVVGGNSCLIKALADTLGEFLHLDSPLIRMEKEESRIALYFKDQLPIIADKVILALPASTLKDVQVGRGVIPEDQLQAIQTLQYGSGAKIILPVKLNHLETPEYLFTSDCLTWFNVSHSIMTLYYGDKRGVFNLSDAAEILEKDLKIISTLAPHIEFSKERAVAMSWMNEPYSKGSWSNYGVGQEPLQRITEYRGEKIRHSFRPVNDQIFFAGEHTSARAQTTMEGAVESGEIAARLISLALGGKKNSDERDHE